MARVNNLSNFLTDVASAIKTKKGSETAIPAADFDTEILSIETAGNYQSKTLNITQNGNYNLLPDQEFDAISNVNISVSVSPVLQNKTITENGSYTADQNYDGLGTVIVNVPQTGDVPVKLFETEEQIQADTEAKEGDLAIVYRSEIQNATVDSKFQVANFPETVILDSVITDYVDIRYRATDSSVMFDCWGMIDSSRFMMNCYSDSGEVRIEYTSSDGITYTRTDNTGNPVDFGTEIYYERTEMWNDAIGKFIQVGGSTFEGLYEYKQDTNKLMFPSFDSVTFNSSTNELIYSGDTISSVYDVSAIKDVINTMITDITDFTSFSQALLYIDNNDNLCIIPSTTSEVNFVWTFLNDNILYGVRYSSSSHSENVYSINLVDKTYTLLRTISDIQIGDKYCLSIESLNCKSFWLVYNASNNKKITFELNTERYKDGSFTSNVKSTSVPYGNGYIYATTQLDATPDYVYGKEFYGKNGVEVGTLGTPDNSFADTNAGVYSKIQKQYENMEPRVLTDDDKTIDKNIYFIPVKKDGTLLLDTSKVTNMQYLFDGCKNLTTIPLLDTSKVTNMESMFNGCSNLTTIPLLDTSKVTNMRYLFNGCSNLTTIPLLDTSSATNMSYMFNLCTNLTTIPLLDTSKVTNMESMFNGCSNLTTIPLLDTSKVTNMRYLFNGCSNLTTIPLLDTSKVTNMQYLFDGCKNLITIPLLNTSKVIWMDNMFRSCSNLSDESLNNILAMCKNATSYTGTKTLKHIGLTSAQATKCTTLSNYSAFTSAGWTTGY